MHLHCHFASLSERILDITMVARHILFVILLAYQVQSVLSNAMTGIPAR